MNDFGEFMSDEPNIRNKGKKNVNIVGNVESQGNQYVENINIHETSSGKPSVITVDAERIKIKQIGVNRDTLLSFGGIVTFLGIVGSLASVYGILGLPPLSPWTTIASIVGMGIVVFALYFKFNVEYRLPFFGSIEVDDEGNFYITDTVATCPFCAGRMRLYPGAKNEISPVLVCQRDSRHHRLSFSMSTLPPLQKG